MIRPRIPEQEVRIAQFEYKVIQERVIRDSTASYALMVAFVALSQAIFVTTLSNIEKIDAPASIGAAIASLSALIAWYLVDRRFVWAQTRRIKRLEQIERELGIYNQRLFLDINEEIEDDDFADMLRDIDKDFGIYSKIRVHWFYGILCILMIIAWAFVIINNINF